MGHEKLVHGLFNVALARVDDFQLADSILDGEHWLVSPLVQISPETRSVLSRLLCFCLG